MNAHPIPETADLVELIDLSRRWQLDDDLAARKARRPIGQQLYRDRAARKHRERMEAFRGEAK